MKGFRSRLEAVARLRSYELSRARAELGEAQERLAAAERAIARAADRLRARGDAVSAHLAGGAEGAAVPLMLQGLDHLRERRQAAAVAVEEASTAIPPARERVLLAHQRNRAMEILEERERERTRRVLERRNQAAIDELAVMRAAREARQ